MNERHRCSFSEKSRNMRELLARKQAEVKHCVKRTDHCGVGVLRGALREEEGRENARESGGNTSAEIRADVYAQLYTFCLFKLVQINIHGPPRFMGISKYTSHFISNYYGYDTRTAREIRTSSAESCLHVIEIRRIIFFLSAEEIFYARHRGKSRTRCEFYSHAP